MEKILESAKLIKHANLANEVSAYVKDIVGDNSIIYLEDGAMASEDFAAYTSEVPSVYFMLGAAIHAYSAVKWLQNNK